MTAPSGPAEPPRTTMNDLRSLLEATTLQAGVEIYDRKLVRNPGRAGTRVYAEVQGTEDAYRVIVDLAPDRPGMVRSSCTCPGTRFRGQKVCKHMASVLVAWASAPRAFAIVAPEAIPADRAPVAGAKRPPGPKRGRVDADEQVRKGIAALESLLSELASGGLGTMTRERVVQIRNVVENLRPLKLRRLAPQCIELADLLTNYLTKEREFDSEAYAHKLADLAFQIRGLRRLLEREDRESDEYRRLADELLGRTWSDKALTAVRGLKLLDLAYRKWTTPDGFLVEESLLADVDSGDLYTDRLIRPPIIAKRQAPKEDFGRNLLHVAEAGIYPGYPPRRIRLKVYDRLAPNVPDLDPLLTKVPSRVEILCQRYREYAADVFAPRPAHVLFCPRAIAIHGDGLLAVDDARKVLALALDPSRFDRLEGALRHGKPRLLMGTLDATRDGLVFQPIALMTVSPGDLTVTTFA